MCQRKVDLDMLNAVKSVLADVSSVSQHRSYTFTKQGWHSPVHLCIVNAVHFIVHLSIL